ncbi:MAG: hypothetical protein D6824_02900, partial [Planctomycetota bacterium]
MAHLINPILLYGLLAVGAVGAAGALPRARTGGQTLGALLAAIAAGALLLTLALAAGPDRPSLYFYIFAFIALGASLRVVTHPRPVYAALYFILTVLASAGLFTLLGAEFLTFALVIIYAGAILITYLFVIMLATEAPREERLEALAEYDAHSQSPALAVVLGFALLGTLTGMLNQAGAAQAADSELQNKRRDVASQGEPAMALLREKARDALLKAGFPDDVRVVAVTRRTPYLAYVAPADPAAFEALVQQSKQAAAADKAADETEASQRKKEGLLPASALALLPPLVEPIELRGRTVFQASLPADVAPTNIEAVGVALLHEHPLALELAGVLLLMAMLA